MSRILDWMIGRITPYVGCSFCRLMRRPEHLIGRHWYLPANWRSFIRWPPNQWVSQCYVIECDRSFYCALFCVFMTRVSHCPISLRAEHPIHSHKLVLQSVQRYRYSTHFSVHCYSHSRILSSLVVSSQRIYNRLTSYYTWSLLFTA
jgi:hypothetical protein